MAKIGERSNLNEAIKALCDVCHQRDIALPWLITAMAFNGSVLSLRARPAHQGKGVELEVLAGKNVGEKMDLPIHFLIVDGKGEAHHASITKEAVTFH